jgi:hypothetical protein
LKFAIFTFAHYKPQKFIAMKNWKTTALGVIGGLVTILISFNVFSGPEGAELRDILGIGVGFIASLIGFFAKDSDAVKVIAITLISTALMIAEDKQEKEVQTFEAIETKHVEFSLLAAA